jgi:hypothetical protein
LAQKEDSIMTLIDHLIKSVQAAAKVNRTVQTPPAAILWTDKERHWEAVAAGLHARMLDPDMNDSVNMNIQSFMTDKVLRHNKNPKLNVLWSRERGKDIESDPWFKIFYGERINDHHLKLAVKPSHLS